MKLAAFPKCYMDEMVRDRTMTLFQWIDMAADACPSMAWSFTTEP